MVTARTTYVGKPVRRVEDKRMLLGRGQFVADIKLSGMLHMAVLRSTHAHARILSINTEKALAHPDVVAVLTYDDIRDEVNPLPVIDMYPDTVPAFYKAMADDKVRFVGEAVAVVVAKDRYTAEDALELIEVNYEPLPVVLDLEKAADADSPLVFEEHGTNLISTARQEVGDVETAFAEADRIFKEEFRVHRYTGIPMETRGVIASWEPGPNGRLTVWSATQFPHLARGFIAGCLSIPQSRVRVIAPDVGGGFGIKFFYPEELIVPLLAKKIGRPVKWIEDRMEHFQASYHAREQIHHLEMAVKNDGTITAMTTRSYTSQGGALATASITPASIYSAMLRGWYRIPNYRAESHAVMTNKTPLGVYRGAGHPQATLCIERMMDIIAREMGIDRVELRRKNLITKEEMPSDRGTDIVLAGHVEYDSGDYEKCLDMALEMMDYKGFLKEQAEARKQGRYLGMGISCYVEESAIGPYESAYVRVDGGGKVTLLTGASPHGQGTVTALSQLVADEFQIDIADITVLHGDTDIIPDGIGTFASRNGPIAGAAARKAAEKVRLKAMKLAAHHMEIGVEDLEWSNGSAVVKGSPDRSMSLAQLAQSASAWATLPEGIEEFDLAGSYHHQVPGIAFANGTHIAVVEIDPGTGQVKLNRYGTVGDCGTVINPMIVEGQVHGGVAQGIGGALLEELVYDDNGQLLTTTFMDYLLPTANEVPFIETGHLETPSPLNPYGMKGVGEGGLTGSAAAVVNAVADALAPLGVKITDHGPFSPARVLKLIKEANGQG